MSPPAEELPATIVSVSVTVLPAWLARPAPAGFLPPTELPLTVQSVRVAVPRKFSRPPAKDWAELPLTVQAVRFIIAAVAVPVKFSSRRRHTRRSCR